MEKITICPPFVKICFICFLFFTGFVFAQVPTITSFTPTSGGFGTVITISGTNLTNVELVVDNNFFTMPFVVVSDTQINATIPGNATTGVIRIKPFGTNFFTPSTQIFTFISPPNVTAMTPVLQTAGGSVVLTGANLSNASAVSFDGNPATSFVVNSDSQISAIASANTLGEVTVTTPGGTASFVFPTISSFTPASQSKDGQVIITGTKFTGATNVSFGNVPGSFVVNSDTQITATVGNGASGDVKVTIPGGNSASLSGFTFLPAPTITGFSPTSSAQGGTVTINGNGFTGATSVTFGGVPASGFTVNNATQITATVGNGASGSISVTTPIGAGTRAGFIFIPAPTITSFTPNVANNGTVISVFGTNFFLGGSPIVSAVKIINVPVTSFNVISNNEIEAVFNATGLSNGQSGIIEVTTSGGVAISTPLLTFDNTLSLDNFENSLEQIKLFPNPAHDIVQVSLPIGLNFEDVILDVFSIDGRKLNLKQEDSGRLRVVDVKSLPVGIYFISVKTTGQFKTYKFIKN